ncbi:hypothetical protein PanWU01x14_094400 [Parasponia andersonii]|uniref:Uncharacterized protein n=1 Tax=Parasponia andersonii TaxID=3476 RepID=A0A2P5D5Q5_PARAD|nr:hypothetical protein PanWU01x14_094400 [Parasponia andersonii]
MRKSVEEGLKDPYYEQSDEELMGKKSRKVNEKDYGAKTSNMGYEYMNVDDIYMESGSEYEDKDELRSRCESDLEEIDALVDKKTCMVKTINEEHTCGLNFSTKYISAKWLVEKYESKWRSDPNWSLSSFKQQVREETQCDVLEWQFYKARNIARKKIQGSVKEQYARLWDYCEELRRTDLGSTIIMKCNAKGPENPLFERIYVCLSSCKKGFLAACRPLIGLGGCHIKGQHRGQILTAIGIDPNNSTFSITYAVVDF